VVTLFIATFFSRPGLSLYLFSPLRKSLGFFEQCRMRGPDLKQRRTRAAAP
jgi:hypothetical protein